ncbi:hypothetical protein BN8_01034 [Fibrisoma limi BUZ 3]|uniref:Outer membrane lipoprotein-sorting protein n=1 Tax=Fibrisoma limi BUZ 3 TaxID=1185876 RepID=I2GDT7_9BACT|nr:hypothetical protein [Fibrisoma limi]CCH52061.1 hypothetical protein BN8_01034 [Fibrisoma limi BUZ 3]
MRKLASTFCLLLTMAGSAMAQTTPTAEAVMDKYLAAIGGKDLVKGITDLRVDMSSDFNGNPIMITRKSKAPNKFAMVVNANGMEVMKMTSDGSKVSMGGMQGNRTIEGAEAQPMILQSMLFPEVRAAEAGIKSTVAGTEKVNGKDAYKVVHTSSDGSVSWTDFYDADSGLKVQTISKQRMGRGGNEVEQTTTYSDYKDFKGLKYPTVIAQLGGGQQRQMTVDKVKFNEGTKDSEFAAN